jgi:putative phosphoesterase
MPGRNIIGLISDTHGLLRPEALDLLRGSDFIVHAGDIGAPEILAELACLAPVTAIRGNVDRAAWAQSLPETEVLAVGEAAVLYVIHDLAELDLDPAAAGFLAVISGHSHKPGFQWKDGVLYVNPGSAGPRRISLPVSVARLIVDGDKVAVDLMEFEPMPRNPSPPTPP